VQLRQRLTLVQERNDDADIRSQPLSSAL
jgi:hypothetical protein